MLNAAAQMKSPDGGLTTHKAIRIAWVVWLTLLVIPFFLFLYIVWKFADNESAAGSNDGVAWFVLSAIYMLAVVPVSFFWRNLLFQSYWSGHPVHPNKYLSGMVAMWIALVVGGLLSLLGCLYSGAMLPDLLPALVAFMFFVTLWPSGRAMTQRVGNAEDPEVYEEPR
jgi:hypothetical protein